ncbi:MAG TPA: hypothetical protein VHX86_16735 [Tepidisphaeraceae bacterium]|jgi:hypothetical protein|nr:hypothetical protein [Tepidisphaeraceae bacterium]
MRPKYTKTADDVIVSDPDAAMRRTIDAIRHIISVPKKSLDKSLAKERAKKKRK